jgi:hypothetical protein
MGKAPYRVLYSNDTSNILTCQSPFNPRPGAQPDPETGKRTYRPSPFTAEMLEASVDETAGVGINAHLLQPGLGWVAWWKSAAYPFEEHIRFMKARTGMDPAADPLAAYTAAGGDMVDVFVSRCRRRGLAPFVSLRLNDSHGHEFVGMSRADIPGWAWQALSPTHVEHPEWRLSADLDDWGGRVLNWAIPEVRAHKFAFIRELIEGYDLDGLELDFMRHCKFFRQEETTREERRAIMSSFVCEVRAVLERREARDGRHRWLCVRIPAILSTHDALGIDVGAFAEAGAEMFNLSHYFFTAQFGDHAAIRKLAPQAAMYLEMCHTTRAGPDVRDDMPPPKWRSGYDLFTYRRTTPTQFYTTAHLAYARGLDGVSTFNFVYYRPHGIAARGPFNEPPFEIHRGCADPAFVARQPQHYFLAPTWNDPPALRPLNDPAQPWEARPIAPGETATFTLDLAPPQEGWRQGGRLRIQADADLGNSRWTARFNGADLAETADRAEPYSNPYPPLLGTPAQHRSWTVPASLLKDGINAIEIAMTAGDAPIKLVFLDLAVQ